MRNEEFLNLIASVFKKHAKLTTESYLREMRFLSKFLAPKLLSDCTPGEAFSYYRFLNNSVSCWDGKPYGNKTIKRKILTLFSVYRDAFILDLIDSNPFEKMALIAREIKPTNKKNPYKIQFQKVFDFIHESRHLAHKAIFSVLYGGGLRVSEMVSLRKEDAREVYGLIGLSVVTALLLMLREA